MVYDPRCWMPGDGSLSSWIENAQGRSSEPEAPSGLIDLHVGADLGRVRDHTAVAVTEVKTVSELKKLTAALLSCVAVNVLS